MLYEGNIESRQNIPGQISRNVELRNHLDLFSYIMHCKSFPGVETRHKDVDIVIVRQNTEGEYAMLEHEVSFLTVCQISFFLNYYINVFPFQNAPGIVESLKVVTRANSERLARHAFELATKMGRKKVTTVHKANIM